MPRVTFSAGVLVFAGLVFAQAGAQNVPVAEKKLATPDALQAEIKALKAPKVAWREIAWKSCLLEGLKEAGTRTSRPCSGSSSIGPLTTRAAEGTPTSPVR